ncbi:hypothetical protein FisN_19Hh279 [Fistulifera solaris]|uniref:Uncharacterized protein n=1 Tax=Fistulifera solaris TaxID=1519565 RepID=A0A1Z5K063_FISSO|nr:hypothetical protein FisN_19Hh279 [Fistulifera solaris]|eukprot:GAX19693.1 hypothetical protein FisN_19Hh279 [Fistulifera solaris]
MFHARTSRLPFFADNDDDVEEEDLHLDEPVYHDNTPQRLEQIHEQLQETHLILDKQNKWIKERDKKLFKLKYLLEHGTLPPTEPRPASSLNGISVGAALRHLCKSPDRPLLEWFESQQSTLSTLTCPYEMDPREGYSRWVLCLMLADTLWTDRDQEMVRQATQDPLDQEFPKEVQCVLDHLDTWVVRATAALEGQHYTNVRKPFIPGAGKILGTKSLNFREFIVPFQRNPQNAAEFQHTTPLREWIQQQEQVILEKKRAEKARKREEKARVESAKRQKWLEAMETSVKNQQPTNNSGGERSL